MLKVTPASYFLGLHGWNERGGWGVGGQWCTVMSSSKAPCGKLGSWLSTENQLLAADSHVSESC